MHELYERFELNNSERISQVSVPGFERMAAAKFFEHQIIPDVVSNAPERVLEVSCVIKSEFPKSIEFLL